MALNIIGLGLWDKTDVSVKGLELIKNSDIIYLEHYTSILGETKKEELEEYYGKEIILAPREVVEQGMDDIIKNAKEKEVSFLVIGDVFSATTHIALKEEAEEKDIKVRIVNNASVLIAVGILGLELYKYGKAVSIPFHHEYVKSAVEGIKINFESDLHTLVLLDLHPIENKFMQIKEASGHLIEKGLDGNLIAVGCAGLGSDSPEIITATLRELSETEFGKVPQCIVIPSKKLHFVEEDCINRFKK